MNRRTRVFGCLLLALPGLLGACATDAADAKIELAPGWKARLDSDSAGQNSTVRLAATSGGLLAYNGPNAVFYHPKKAAKGRYSLSVEVHHLDSHGHPHGAGVMFGGSDLSAAAQAYTYFLVRGDGFFLIKTRNGEETKEVKAWTKHDAVKPDGADGTTKNALRVDVGATETVFRVNGVEVHRAANASLHTAGLYGFRMVHDLKVLFAKLKIEGGSG